MGKLSSEGASEFAQLRDGIPEDAVTPTTSPADERQELERQIAEIADGRFDPSTIPDGGSVLDEAGNGLMATGVATPVVYTGIRRAIDTAPERSALSDARAHEREHARSLAEVRRHEQARDNVGADHATDALDREIAKVENREAFWERARQRAEAVRLEAEAAERARFEAEHGAWDAAIRDITTRGDEVAAQLADSYLASPEGPQDFLRRVRDTRAAGVFGGSEGLNGGRLGVAAESLMPQVVRAFEEGRPDILGTLYRFDRPLAEEIARRRSAQIAEAANRGVRFAEPGSAAPDVPAGGYPGVGNSIAQHPDVRAWRLFDDAAKAWSSDVGRFLVDDGSGGLTFRKVAPEVGHAESVLPSGLGRAVADSAPWYVSEAMSDLAGAVQERAAATPEPQQRRPGIRSRLAGAEAEFEGGRAEAARQRLAELRARRDAARRGAAAAERSHGGRPSLNEQRRAAHEADADRANARANNAETNAETARTRAVAARGARPTLARRATEGVGLGAGLVLGGAALRSVGEERELRKQLEDLKRQSSELDPKALPESVR